MVAWSVVASMQAFMSGRASFWACRFLLGAIEGGFIPDMILYLSYFYTSSELPRRLAFFWGGFQTTNIVAAVRHSHTTARLCRLSLMHFRETVSCIRHPSYARCWRKSWMVLAVRPRGHRDRTHWHRLILLPPSFSIPDCFQRSEYRMVYRTRGKDHGKPHLTG